MAVEIQTTASLDKCQSSETKWAVFLVYVLRISHYGYWDNGESQLNLDTGTIR